MTASAQDLTPQSLMGNERFENQVCGMDRTLLEKVRSAVKDVDALQELCNHLISSMKALLGSKVGEVAVMVGPPFGKTNCSKSSGNDPSVVIWLLLDPLDVDSKQSTFVRSPNAKEIFQVLYKFSPST
eukprot:CAMPEP_0181323872 /NCGR_PEP_ID=MMETSP1101-20121128/20036_1 /TAXON_ID=46948 /ORGANISM="Rhodomonas abbreviata, Strain Caron Lab Isolate" /LENGTH=127 /DNA_ID=CAMNT_0023431967 /DNA_START=57 /DNA_END=440 /DNA_ORIENTATION=-